MPADQRLEPDHHQGIVPIEEPGQQRQRHPRRGVDAPRLDAALPVQRELPADKEILRCDGSPRSERQRDEAGQVGK
jgi:hypothetical protein